MKDTSIMIQKEQKRTIYREEYVYAEKKKKYNNNKTLFIIVI